MTEGVGTTGVATTAAGGGRIGGVEFAVVGGEVDPEAASDED